MKRNIAKLWSDTLRSRKYKQGQQYLNKDGKFCCLGVLCDLAVKAGVKVQITENWKGAVEYDGQAATVPFEVMRWSGMVDSGGGRFMKKDDIERKPLYELNDGGMKFNKIANIIDKEWETL